MDSTSKEENKLIELANGKMYNTIVIHSRKEQLQGQLREVFDIHFPKEGIKYEEISSFLTDASAFSKIKIYDDILAEDGSLVLLSEHKNYVLAESVTVTTIDDVARYILKVGKKTDFEIEQEIHAVMLEEQQMALIELASIIA